MEKFLFLIFYFKPLVVCCSGQLWTISASAAWKGLLWHLILSVSSVGREQKQPVFLRGFLCPESLKIMLTVKLKSALSGTPRVPPNRAAQGCQRYYTALLKPAVRWKYCPGVHDFVAIKKKKIRLSDLIIPPHAQLSAKGKSNTGLRGPRNPRKGICGGRQKKIQKAKPKQGGKSRFNFPSAQYRHPHRKVKSLHPYDPCVTDTTTNFPQACPPYKFLAVHVNLHNVVH